MVMGAMDTGKSTLSRLIISAGIEQGRLVAYVDADVGQSTRRPSDMRRAQVAARAIRPRRHRSCRRAPVRRVHHPRAAGPPPCRGDLRPGHPGKGARRPGRHRHHGNGVGGDRRDAQVLQDRAMPPRQGGRAAAGHRDGADRRDAPTILLGRGDRLRRRSRGAPGVTRPAGGTAHRPAGRRLRPAARALEGASHRLRPHPPCRSGPLRGSTVSSSGSRTEPAAVSGSASSSSPRTCFARDHQRRRRHAGPAGSGRSG